MQRIPDALAIALAPFAPRSSFVIQQAEEALRKQADLRIDEMKNSGELRRRDDARALAEQIKWGAQ